MEIKNYKLRDFLEIRGSEIERYTNLLKYLDPTPTKHEIKDLTFREVESIKQIIRDSDSLPEVFKYMQGIDEEEFLNLKVVEFYGMYNYITKQLENLIHMEERELIPEHSDYKWEAVEGSERLSVMGILPTIDKLAQGNILLYEEILSLPYLTVFNRLRMDKIKGDIEHDMNKIKEPKTD